MTTSAVQKHFSGSRSRPRRRARRGVWPALIGLGLGVRLLGADVEVTATVEGRGMVLGTGTYAAGTPVTLRAVAQVDWRFDHWEGLPSGNTTNNPVVIEAAAGLQPKAVIVEAPGNGWFKSVGGALVAWGRNEYGQATVPEGLGRVVAIAAGWAHTVVLKGDGSVAAWGGNHYGQATVPEGLRRVVAIAAGGVHTVAVREDGSVAAWGGFNPSHTTAPNAVERVGTVAAGQDHSVALKTDGTVVAWGGNDYGQATVPRGLGKVVAIAAGSAHTVALKEDGSVAAWGWNDYGQAAVPKGLGTVVAVAAGDARTAVVKEDGTVVAWGSSDEGQTTVPEGLGKLVSIALGFFHVAALKEEGSVAAWGRNSDGQATVPVGLRGVVAIAAGGEHTVALNAERLAVVAASPAALLRDVGQSFLLAPRVALATTYQWYHSGLPIPGATAMPLEVGASRIADSGTYQLLAMNESEALLTPPTEVKVVPVGYPWITVNGEQVFAATRQGDQAEIKLATSLPNGQLFYTLDGSEATLGAREYTAPFTVTNTVVVRAVAVSAIFTQQVTNEPVRIEIVPTFTVNTSVAGAGSVDRDPWLDRYLQDAAVTISPQPSAGWRFVRWEGDLAGTNATAQLVMDTNKTIKAVFEPIPKYALAATTAGGGTIAGNSGSPYYESTVVSLTATPLAGWQFLRWQGGASGTDTNLSLTMDRARSVEAVFGTTVSTRVTGPGRVELIPPTGPYPYRSTVLVVGVPDAGNYLTRWGNAASGTFNPLAFLVTNGSPTVSALFAAIPAGQVTLSVSVAGTGFVTADPSKNTFTAGEVVRLTAVPGPGQVFERWSGSGSSDQSSFALTMDADKQVVANFRRQNHAPFVSAPVSKELAEGALLEVAVLGGDTDQPPDAISFSLVNPPAGATIDPATGLFTWTPTETQGPGVHTIAVRVTDDGFPPLSATNSFTVTVTEVNEPPVLAAVPDQSVEERSLLTVAPQATDPDLPPNPLVYRLVTAPPSAVIDAASGRITWTPSEEQGSQTYPFTVEVNDQGVPPFTDQKSFNVTVTKANQPPVFTPVADLAIDEGLPLALPLAALDIDIPTNHLTYALLNAPPGATIDPLSGVITWVPTEDQGPGSFDFVATATDDGTPPLTATNAFKVAVREVNQAPVLAPIADQTVDELSELAFPAAATDGDIPANKLAFSLLSAPTGAGIDAATGRFTWMPTETQGPSTNVVVVKVSDDGVPSLSATNQFTVNVREVNSAPVLAPVTRQTIDELSPWAFSAPASDADVPTNTLAFTLVSAPEGVGIDASSGRITWTPTEAQGPSTNTLTLSVQDDGAPPLSATNTFEVVVREVNTAPVLSPIADATVDELSEFAFAATATDGDVPTNRLTFTLISAPTGAGINPETGRFTWTPSEAQGPSTNTVVVEVSDDGTPALSATNQFKVVVREVNTAPVLSPIADQTVDELRELTFTATATDADVPANTLTFTLEGAPVGAVIDPATGRFTWIPSEAQGGTNYTVRVKVTDSGGLSDAREVKITVQEVNSPPVLVALGDATIDELTELALTASATDSDLPAQTLTYSLEGAPGGMSIDASDGRIRWTPTEAQGPSTNRITVRVTDDGVPAQSATRGFTVTVREVNTAPTLAAVPNQSASPGVALEVVLVGSDADLPVNALTYSLVSGPSGATVTANRFHWTPTESLGDRTEQVTVKVEDDGAPRLSAQRTFEIRVSVTAPMVTITAPVAGATADERFELKGTATDDVGVTDVRWFWNDEARGELTLSSGAFRAGGLTLKRGENRLRVVAKDGAGNEGAAEVVVTWTPMRTLTVQDAVETQEGRKAVFPLSLDSAGDVGGMSFVLRYDPDYLRDPLFTWSGTVGNSVNQVNTDVAGEVVATFSLPGNAVPSGQASLAEVSFRARSVPFMLETTLEPEVVDVSGPGGDKLVFGTDAVAGTVRLLPRRMPGDNNGNNRLDIGDATLIQRLLARLDPVRTWDVTGNDLNASADLDSGDVTKVLRVVVGLDAQPTLGPGLHGVRSAEFGVRNDASSLDTHPAALDLGVSLATLGAPSTNEAALLLPTQQTGQAGQPVTYTVVLTNVQSGIAGVALSLEYPTNALRLLDATSHRVGALVPANAVKIWNVAPAQNNYLVQTGKVSLAASSAAAWPERNGVLAEFTFQVQAGAAAQASWPIRLSGVELTSDGFEVRTLPEVVGLLTTGTGPTPQPVTLDAGASGLKPDGFHLVFGAVNGARYEIQDSEDLVTWERVATVPAAGTRVEHVLPVVGKARFYRVRSL